MNYQMQVGYQQPYPQIQEVLIETSQRPYYNQPMIVQPSPQVIIVQDPYANQAVATKQPFVLGAVARNSFAAASCDMTSWIIISQTIIHLLVEICSRFYWVKVLECFPLLFLKEKNVRQCRISVNKYVLEFDLNINYNLTGKLIQMELLKQLSSPEQDEFNRIRVIQNGIDDRTLEQSLKYYLEYKKNTAGHISHEKLPIVFKSALFMAEKSVCCTTVNGERIAEPSLTLGHLLKTHPLDEVMITLKDFTKNVTINDKQAASQLNNLIKEISFLITFHKKFEKSVEKFELKERNPQSGEYVKHWSHFAWLLYIQVRSKLLMKSLDLIENTCMLAHTLAFMLSFSWDHIIPTGILKQEKRLHEQSNMKQVIYIVREKVLEMFSIKTVDIYASLANTFENFFEMELVKKQIIKIHPPFDFLSPDLLMTNYRRLDKFYEKNMNGIDLDERVFLKERTSNMTPSKFTPFARQGYANRGRKSGQNEALRQNCSHRILNYELCEKQQNTIKIGGDGVNIGRLPKAIVASPSLKVPLIQATPVTAGMEMANYINDRAKRFQDTIRQGFTKRPYQSAVIKHIELIFDKSKKQNDKKIKQPKEQMVYCFFKLALEQYLSQHPTQKDNEKCYKALMGICIELYLFANNSALMFEDVEKEINIEPFQLWKACDFFLKFDKGMPASLRLHIIDIQAAFVSYKVLKDDDFVQMIHDIANGEKINSSSNLQFFERFFRRLLLQIAFQIRLIGSKLNLQQGVLQAIYDIMKHIINESTDLLLNRHIDQLIMCTIFAINRKQRLDIKFADIIQAYKESNEQNRDMHEALVKQIVVEDKEPLNLISYYNECYIKRLKEFVMNIKPSDYHQENKKNYANNPVLMSPLKDILPNAISKRNLNKMTTKVEGNSNKELLVAYSDSPLLRHQPIAFKANTFKVQTGIIDFDQNIHNINNEDKKQYEKHSPRNYPTEASKKPSMNNMGCHWKQPEQVSGGGLTPNRSKNITPQPTVPLNQFSSNSSQNSNMAPQARISTNNFNANKNPYSQYGMANLAKGGLRKFQ